MKIINKISGTITCFVAAAAFIAAGCEKTEDVKVHANFTTDKEVYEINEDIFLTNTSYSENARITASKWEWGNGNKLWSIHPDKPISFPEIGEYDITLTAVAISGGKNIYGTCVKRVKIQDTNIRPIADFTYEPVSGIRAGDKVKFTDKSADPDGKIVSWEWKFGNTTVKEQNPEFTFAEYGDIEVRLTVTDNMKGTDTKTTTIHVEKSIYSLELVWSVAYEKDPEAWVSFTSPAVSPDGSTVYVFSSGCNLAAYSSNGEHKWTFNANIHHPNPYRTAGDKKGTTTVPAVDQDGNIIIALAYNEKDTDLTTYESGVYSITPDGKQKWYFPFGNARYINVVPVIIGDQIIITTKKNPTKAQYPDLWATYGNLDNGQIIDRNTGFYLQTLQVKQGNYGGGAGISDGKFVTHCNSGFGSRLYFRDNAGKWKYYGPSDNKSAKSLGYTAGNANLETGDGSQMAVDKQGRIYLLYLNVTGRVSKSFPSVLYCYDLNKYVKDDTTPFEPEWATGLNGKMGRYTGVGVVIGADGTIYAATGKSGNYAARITAVNPDGTIKWESEADGEIYGSAAIDNEGYIYYNDTQFGKLVKLAPDTGKKVSEIKISDELWSSPSISPDGTIYCTGNKDNTPWLFAVKGSATGYADSWSQLGGNPQKSGVLY